MYRKLISWPSIYSIFILLFCGTCFHAYSQETKYDFATGALQEGSLIDGFIETGIGEFGGVRVNFFEQTTHDLVEVPGEGVQLSTQYNETSRQKIDLLYPFSINSLLGLKSLYIGLSIVRINEENTATFVVVDGLGEYGTDYIHTRETFFYSPRVGAAFDGHLLTIANQPVDANYTVTLSPFYYFTIRQKMNYEYTDLESALDPLAITNNVDNWASPYLNQDLNLRIGDYFRMNLQHTYQFLPYKSIQLAMDGISLEVKDDPTHMNALRLNGDVTLPISGLFTFNIGFGYQWSWLYRTADWLSGDARTSFVSRPYLRIGSSLN